MKKNLTILSLITLLLSGCFTESEKQILREDISFLNFSDVKINYYADKSVSSLEIPPDLTKPSYENSFRLSEYVQDYDENIVNLSGIEAKKTKPQILVEPVDINVKKSGNRRWLVVQKDPETLWSLSKQFLKENGFVIKYSNKKIGVMETDFLENKPEIPAKSLGFFRSMMAATVENVSYTLPSVDMYRIRIEPLSSGKASEVHLSLNSMTEVITGSGSNETTLWQEKPKDLSLETKMLFSLMVYLGSESANAREKIINASEEGKVLVELKDGINGYAKLVFQNDITETWDNLSWAIGEANIKLDDKDIKEKSFYIKVARTSDQGIMTKIFGDEAVQKTYQLLLKQIKNNATEIIFNDISEQNDKETKQFSYELLGRIQKLF